MKGLRLYDYPAIFAEIDRALDLTDGELNEGLEKLLDELTGSFQDKVHSYCALIRNFEKEGEDLAEEAQRLSKRADTRKKTAKAIKERLKATMISMKIEKTEAFPFKVRIQKNSTPTLKLADGVGIIDIDPRFVRVVRELDRDAVLAAVKEDPEATKGLVLVEHGTHLRIV